jgi:hypothetical protein
MLLKLARKVTRSHSGIRCKRVRKWQTFMRLKVIKNIISSTGMNKVNSRASAAFSEDSYKYIEDSSLSPGFELKAVS